VGEGVGRGLWAGLDFAVFFESQVGATTPAVRRNGQLGFLLAVLAKGASDLAGPLVLVFEKTEGQGAGRVTTLGGCCLPFVAGLVALFFVISASLRSRSALLGG